jgi:hypothetical protein
MFFVYAFYIDYVKSDMMVHIRRKADRSSILLFATQQVLRSLGLRFFFILSNFRANEFDYLPSTTHHSMW